MTDSEKSLNQEESSEYYSVWLLRYFRSKNLQRTIVIDFHPETVPFRLVFDVIKMHNPAIRKALIFACSNSLVCDNSNDARIVSSGEIRRHRVKYIKYKCNEGLRFLANNRK